MSFGIRALSTTLLVVLGGCAEPSSVPATPSTASAAPARVESARARLERVIIEAGPDALRDGCYAAPVLAQLDAPEAGDRLDRLVASYAAAPTLDARDTAACYPRAVTARLLRKWRTRELDVDAELRNANPKIRGAVVVLLAHAHARPDAIRAALDDPDFGVRMNAYTAVGEAKDHAAEPRLEAIVARAPADSPDRTWACSTLVDIRGSSPCPDAKGADGLFAIGGWSSKPFPDHCTELHTNLSSTDANLLARGVFALLHDRSRRLTRPFDSIARDAPPAPDCGTPDSTLDALLARPEPGVRALAPATLLATAHAPLPTTPAELSPR